MSQDKPAGADWLRQQEKSNLAILRLMVWISLTFGRRLGRLVLYGIAAYYVLFAPLARRYSRQYLHRALNRWAEWSDGFRHVFSFASTIHDRIYLLNDADGVFDVKCFGLPQDDPGMQAGQGAFLFGAHLGSFEVLRAAARRDERDKLSVAMYPENARQINEALAAINPNAVSNIIALGKIDSILTIHQRLKDGGMVGILADRAVGQDQYMSLPFMGSPASFPIGPFRLAAMLGQPVYFMTGLYRGGNRYEVHFELLADFADKAGKSRDTLIHELMTRYVTTLERYCKLAPFNWFNFYDFWGEAHLGSR